MHYARQANHVSPGKGRGSVGDVTTGSGLRDGSNLQDSHAYIVLGRGADAGIRRSGARKAVQAVKDIYATRAM